MSHHRMTPAAFALAASVLLLITCTPRTLSRSSAEKLLDKSESFSKGKMTVQMNEDQLKCGIDQGLWTVTRPGIWRYLYLTSKGKTYFSDAAFAMDTPTVTIIAPRHVVEITGITPAPAMLSGGTENSAMIAEYTWEWDWSGLSEEVKRCVGEKRGSPQHDQALFRRYDDGWRLTEN